MLSSDQQRSLREALRFAVSSGAWVVEGSEVPDRPEPQRDSPAPESGDPAPRLAAIRQDIGDCTRCRLHEGRGQIVFGVGDPAAEVLVVGEAPGEEEDRKGEPFVGRAGRLLDAMIHALGLQRCNVYIANVVKCRPPRNREPREDEAATCMPFLWLQIDAVRPRVVLALGAQATKSLVGVGSSIGSLRGRPQRARGWNVLPTYHPAYLLRNPMAKRLAWQDLKRLRDILRGEA